MNDIDNMLATLRSTEPYLDDNGFTAVVMEQVPGRAGLPMWKKNAILLVSAGLGSGFAALQVPLGQIVGLWNKVAIDIFALDMPILLGTVGAAAFIVYSLSCGAIWAAQRDLI